MNLIVRLLKDKILQSVLGLLLVVILLRCLWLWQPERQVLLHQNHFLDSAEKRDWNRFSGFIAASYSDRWGHDKGFVIKESSEVLRQFFALTIQRDQPECRLNGDRATVRLHLKLEGKGTPIATLASSMVDGVKEPFSFEWKRQSWKPWDWVLISADQPELHLEGMESGL